MAAKQAASPKRERQSSTKISRDLLKMIGVVAKHRGTTIPAYLEAITRPIVYKDYLDVTDEARKSIAGKS